MGDFKKQSDLDQLLGRLVDGEATAAEIAALEILLDGNPDAQRRYVHYLDLHGELLLKSNMQPVVSINSNLSTLIGARPTTRQIIVSALVASILIAFGLRIGQWMNPPSGDDNYAQYNVDDPISPSTIEDSRDDGVAVLTHAVDVEWSGKNKPQAGSILSPGTLNLSGGLIQIEFYNGVQLIVEGPADLEIVSVASVICHEGKLRSLVPQNARGFSVLTPKFDLVDLGTEFAVYVASDGRSDVHVFEGEVELYLPDGKRELEQKQVLLGGQATQWLPTGIRTSITPNPEAFASFEDMRVRDQSLSQKRFVNWQRGNVALRDNPQIVARYDFESDGSRLVDRSETKAHGTIIGCEWTVGRWPDKRALEFKRPGDRVRIDLPGEFDALTLMAWVRVDALPSRQQSLLLTDNVKIDHLHWQITGKGELRISSRIPAQVRTGIGYSSPPVFTPRQIGVWNCVCSTYDRSSRTVTHWFNGQQVFRETLKTDLPMHIGLAEIGNWGMQPRPAPHKIRNFIGRIDELTIWNVALNEHQIAEIYENSRP
ncbi:MAG: hypothetical protein COA78_15960 [Blastopirellula sp.]|nr:MAG: hypothetical protein COA78_15960 [Blastopirellula sp.]